MFERRKANMQLQLWPTDQESTQKVEIWQSLEQQDKAAVITALARLMVRVICSNNSSETQEEKHE
jgi:hypothetical protein